VIALPEADWTIKAALRTQAFWLVLGAFSVSGLGLTGTLVYRVGFWKDDVGLSSSLVALGTAMDPFTVIFSSLAFGILGERLRPRMLGLIGGIGWSISMLPMIFATDAVWMVFAHNIMWGLAAGSYITCNNLIWPDYYGRRFLGTLRGLVTPLQIIMTGVSAPLFGLILDSGVEPRLLWTLSLGLFATAGLMLFMSKPPRMKSVAPVLTGAVEARA
jgi:hypothetical protein